MKQPITISHRDRTLYGTLYRPNTETFPLVVFSHGYNGHETDFANSAETLLENGIGSFCFTFCGGSTRDKSGFPTAKMTVLTELEDLLAVIDFFKTYEGVQKENIFLFGGSMGGAVSALAAENIPEDIRGLILLFPAFCIPDDWKRNVPNPLELPEKFDFWGMGLGREFDLTARKLDFSALGNFKKPVLILHGDQDKIVPLQYSENAAKRYSNAELIVFPKEGHGFTENGKKKVNDLITSFVQNNL